jgi:hypothetical protein
MQNISLIVSRAPGSRHRATGIDVATRAYAGWLGRSPTREKARKKVLQVPPGLI